NVYETLMAARGKPVLFFPARFDLHEVQASDGYAYNIAIQRFNMDFSQQIGSFVSTDAQGDWWGGAGGGTVAHAAIASFMGDTAEAICSSHGSYLRKFRASHWWISITIQSAIRSACWR